MITIYPEKDCVLRNKVNGVFSFMANTSHPENWENVSISEYHPEPEPEYESTIEDKAEAYDILIGGAAE